MVYFEKNDLFDEVWLRYKDSYNCTVDCDLFVPQSDIDYYWHVLRKNMRADLKNVTKDAKKLVKRLRKADRKARRKAWRKAVWAKITGIFRHKKKRVSAPITTDTQPDRAETLPQTVPETVPATVEEQSHEQ